MCNFNLADLASPDTGEVLMRPELASNIDNLLSVLLGELRITSGYRTPQHNKKVGGARNSYHRRGMAIDCYAKHLSHKKLGELALEMTGFTTAIVYKSHVHLDIREKGLGLRKS